MYVWMYVRTYLCTEYVWFSTRARAYVVSPGQPFGARRFSEFSLQDRRGVNNPRAAAS